MKFPIKDFFSKCDQICSFLRSPAISCSFIFCAVIAASYESMEIGYSMRSLLNALISKVVNSIVCW